MRAGAYGLAPHALEALEAVMARELAGLWGRLAGHGELCLVALWPDLGPTPERVEAWTTRDRDRERRWLTPAAAHDRLWRVQDWDVGCTLGPASGQVPEEEVALRRALRAAGCEDLAVACLQELAHRVGRGPAPEDVAVSGDLACFVAGAGPERARASFLEAARPEVVAAYEARGWLAGPDELVAVRAGTQPLGPAAARRLEELVAHEAAAARQSVAHAVGEDVVALIALVWGGPGATVTYLCALTERERDRLGAGALWLPFERWEHQDVHDADRGVGAALEEAVLADLEAVGCPGEADAAVLQEIAHRLAHEPGELRVTADFGAYAIDHEGGEPLASFRAAARPEAVAAYRARGWLVEPYG